MYKALTWVTSFVIVELNPDISAIVLTVEYCECLIINMVVIS
jgi:hypothetical protein